MANPGPGWRRTFDQVEREFGGRLEGLTGSRRFADVAIGGFRLQRRLLRTYERGARTVLHAVHLPSVGDVRRLNRQVAVLTTEVRSLSARLEQEREDDA
ncbi:hypothetical protein DSM112329_05418 [Paraconexibacter sp. AEG42_29]|uniref:Uncharacterized protein n=1 Tax=Paraconexibacter sp. AEG42_29 TaxID=2997339 RepID=A0AAU7B3B4_9ACTN